MISEREAAGAVPYFSFEYFPPRTEDGVKNLYERLDRMAKQGKRELNERPGASLAQRRRRLI